MESLSAYSSHFYSQDQGKLSTVSTLVAVATFIGVVALSALAIQGTISGSVAGWSALGLAGAGGVFSIINTSVSNDDKKSVKIIRTIVGLLITATLCTLAGVGVLSGHTFGWINCGTLIAGVGLVVLMSPCVCCVLIARQRNQEQQRHLMNQDYIS